MDEQKKKSYKLSQEWIDRIFSRLIDIYGHKFTSKFSKPEYMEIEKTRWRSGLYGLTSEDIKKVLNLCLNNKIKEPPNPIEFYHYAKSYKLPPPPKPEFARASLEIKNKYMELIREKLNGSIRNKRLPPVPADNKQVLDDEIPEWLQNSN